MRILVISLVLFLTALPVGAQSTYKSWQNPDSNAVPAASDQKMKEFLFKLNGLIDKAEKARAADPNFLRDLRDLANGSNHAPQSILLSDAFLDGNFEVDPKWTVLNGEYWVEKGWGLRSAIKVTSPSSTPQTTQNQNKDAAAILFGKILSKAIGAQQPTNTAQPEQPRLATIYSVTPITNAFTLETEVSSWVGEGRLEIALYQGTMKTAASAAGYRIAYTPGGRIELVRVSSRGAVIMESIKLASPLEDKKFHKIKWVRNSGGQMTVQVDDQPVLSVVDQGFRDPFAGIAMINSGGDYIVKKITIKGGG